MVIDFESMGWGWERNTMTNWSKRTLRLHSWKTIVLTISNRGSRAQNKWMKKAELAVKGLIIVQKHCYNKGVMYSPLWNFQTAPNLFSLPLHCIFSLASAWLCIISNPKQLLYIISKYWGWKALPSTLALGLI